MLNMCATIELQISNCWLSEPVIIKDIARNRQLPSFPIHFKEDVSGSERITSTPPDSL